MSTRSLSHLHAVVVGSGITGLAAARVLSDRGARVTILERDAEPEAADPATAFSSWQRKGAPQVRHSHAFLGRLRKLLREKYPDLLDGLLAAGAAELDMLARPPLTLPPLMPEPGDADLVALGCRRTTFEWVVRRNVLVRPGVTLLGGAQMRELVAAAGSPPRVTGVRYARNGEEHTLDADLVIDASGRHSRAPAWLEAIGAGAPPEELEQSGVVYYTRFYRFRPGAVEPPRSPHPAAADYNWVKYAIFPADGGVFSITFAIPLAFPRLKVLANVAAFDAMTRTLPALVPWVDPAVSEPIGDPAHPVQAMGGLINRLRRFVVDGRPLARGLFVLGDAAYCTNPLYGRGCAQAFLHADLLGEALDAHPSDLTATAVALDAAARAAIEPFYRASILADREAVRKAEGRQPRRWSGRLRARFFDEGVAIATRCDPVVFRAFVRMFNMLETPEQAFGNPRVLWRSLRVMLRGARRNQRYQLPDPPDQETTIARCEAAVA
ncbi:MAG TPA: FAD-dependent oxidoreductase [Candidatus Dormibacteraeota bacterium]|nr:FAD-dependent oxidoreductase [Candidatus Dormibacteraeota bacterium]